MDTDVAVLSGAMFVLLGFVLLGGPMFVADWIRARRQAVIVRQVALTEALDARLGALVAPVVRKPLRGPWEVRLSVPMLQPAVLARILAAIDEVFSDVGTRSPSAYRIVLWVAPDVRRAAGRGSLVGMPVDTLLPAAGR